MKIRVRLPDLTHNRSYEFSNQPDYAVDEILLWGMETGMDVSFYRYYREPNQTWNDRRRWGIFTVEPVGAMMFSLRWGALLHKNKGKGNER